MTHKGLTFARNGSKLHNERSSNEPPQYGWMEVLVRCLLSSLGIILLLRLEWIINEAGVGLTVLFVFVGFVICLITSRAEIILTAEVENTKGFYHTLCMASNSTFAVSSSLVYATANIFAVALYCIAFSETFCQAFKLFFNVTFIDGDVNDRRIMAIVATAIVLLCSFVHQPFASRVRLAILVLVLLSVLLYVVGLLVSSSTKSFGAAHLSAPLSPKFHGLHSMFSCFAVFFPATMFVAVALNVKNLDIPPNSIKRAASLAVLIGGVIYLAAAMARIAPSEDQNSAMANVSDVNGTVIELLSDTDLTPFPITISLLLASGNEALHCLFYAGHIIQDVGRDGLLPGLQLLSQGFGAHDSPWKANIAVIILAAFLTGIGYFNHVAVLVSVFFLCTYALLNYSAFQKTLDGSSEAKWYRKWLFFVCSCTCLFLSFAISWLFAFLAFFQFFILHCYLTYKQSSPSSETCAVTNNYVTTLHGMHQMVNTDEVKRHYKPQILVLTGNPAARPALVDFAHNITKGTSLMICGYVVPQAPCDRVYLLLQKIEHQMHEWLRKREIHAFGAVFADVDQMEGALTMIQTIGVGSLRPNIVMIGFKTNWEKNGADNLPSINGFFDIVLNSFEKNVGVCIFRVSSSVSFDLSAVLKEQRKQTDRPSTEDDEVHELEMDGISVHSQESSKPVRKQTRAQVFKQNISSLIKSKVQQANQDLEMSKQADKSNMKKNRFEVVAKHSIFSATSMNPHTIVAHMYRFRTRIQKGKIDVWWLKDDGGLTLLLPHLLAMPKSYLEGAHIRVFTKASASAKIDEEQQNMVTLLRKFHIDCTDLHFITDFDLPPREDTVAEFEEMIEPFMYASTDDHERGLIHQNDLDRNKDKTAKYLRISDVVGEHSRDVDLVVMTLPIPRRTTIPSCLYMSWLDMLTRDLPPTLLARGNQTSVASYY